MERGGRGEKGEGGRNNCEGRGRGFQLVFTSSYAAAL